ncbi:MAG: cell division topological specificity factor MinE [Oliverpabstia sp.]|nr:cell division topological specificity factor MinE [Lachnospiraceae bacterium]MDY5027346.1 cell division topological specificity factor MinE [Oliverpabstia sp.]
MSFFSKNRKTSGSIAKDRLKLLLVADRVSCSPQTMQMLKNDMIKAAGKYVPIDSGNVSISFRQSPPVLMASIPLKTQTDI